MHFSCISCTKGIDIGLALAELGRPVLCSPPPLMAEEAMLAQGGKKSATQLAGPPWFLAGFATLICTADFNQLSYESLSFMRQRPDVSKPAWTTVFAVNSMGMEAAASLKANDPSSPPWETTDPSELNPVLRIQRSPKKAAVPWHSAENTGCLALSWHTALGAVLLSGNPLCSHNSIKTSPFFASATQRANFYFMFSPSQIFSPVQKKVFGGS